ncbi:hypothetical protein AP75_09500 [Kaistella haifensis DSM 19056]|uniref:Uncharacterized protein n=1 Tax=Kaistella haifensis DSM 19056 TaxID=1450526 RepID=A0A246B8L1_9FLAO|nr:hypothetical protein [Kaistella haifensis]OWK97782.1 hypothetical protein AP75_09500 [Kaistella haifensis DSM 19056]
MNLTIEIENKEDYDFIKQLLERLKGVKVLPQPYEMIEGVPAHIFEAIDKYGENLKEEDMISKEEFFKFIDDEICRLNSQE